MNSNLIKKIVLKSELLELEESIDVNVENFEKSIYDFIIDLSLEDSHD